MERLPMFALSALLTAGPATAQDSADAEVDYFDRTPEDCITLSRIRDTEVIDESTILFYMRAGRVYRNVLEPTCRGLSSRRVIATTTRTGHLCRSDSFEHFSFAGGQAYPGVFCRFGKFHPVTKDEAALMELDPDERALVARTVELTPIDPEDVERPADETGAAADSEDGRPQPEPADDPPAEAATSGN